MLLAEFGKCLPSKILLDVCSTLLSDAYLTKLGKINIVFQITTLTSYYKAYITAVCSFIFQVASPGDSRATFYGFRVNLPPTEYRLLSV